MKRPVLEAMLGDRFILFGEWLYARHSVHYRRLPHYFFEFDIYDKEAGAFLDLERRLDDARGHGHPDGPGAPPGRVDRDGSCGLIGPSRFDSRVREPADRARPTT